MDFPCRRVTVSANALVRVSSLETKLKATAKALKEADKKRTKEVAAAKLSIDQAVKEANARATKAKKAVAEVSQRQTSHEEAVVKRIDDILTSIGSKCSLTFVFYYLSPLSTRVFTGCIFVMQQNILEKSSSFA
jgi:Skp family chaperone for outer membrane proteins